jgi:hypothetical protein
VQCRDTFPLKIELAKKRKLTSSGNSRIWSSRCTSSYSKLEMDSSVSNIPALLSSIFNSNAKSFLRMELRAASKVTIFPQYSCKISEYVVKTSSMASKSVVDTRKGQTPSAVIG